MILFLIALAIGLGIGLWMGFELGSAPPEPVGYTADLPLSSSSESNEIPEFLRYRGPANELMPRDGRES